MDGIYYIAKAYDRKHNIKLHECVWDNIEGAIEWADKIFEVINADEMKYTDVTVSSFITDDSGERYFNTHVFYTWDSQSLKMSVSKFEVF